MQLCSPTARTLGSLLTNDVWCGQYGKPFEQALQKLYSKNRSRAGWKREWERVIVCPLLQSGVGFMASSPSFLCWCLFPHSSFLSLCTTNLSLPVSPFLSHPLPFNLCSSLPSLSCCVLFLAHSTFEICYITIIVEMQLKRWISKLPQYILLPNCSNANTNLSTNNVSMMYNITYSYF